MYILDKRPWAFISNGEKFPSNLQEGIFSQQI